MKKVTFNSEGRNHSEFAAVRPYSTKPVIESEFFDTEKRYYKLVDGRVFDADLYDKNYKVVNKKIHRKGYKGENACKKMAAIACVIVVFSLSACKVGGNKDAIKSVVDSSKYLEKIASGLNDPKELFSTAMPVFRIHCRAGMEFKGACHW